MLATSEQRLARGSLGVSVADLYIAHLPNMVIELFNIKGLTGWLPHRNPELNVHLFDGDGWQYAAAWDPIPEESLYLTPIRPRSDTHLTRILHTGTGPIDFPSRARRQRAELQVHTAREGDPCIACIACIACITCITCRTWQEPLATEWDAAAGLEPSRTQQQQQQGRCCRPVLSFLFLAVFFFKGAAAGLAQSGDSTTQHEEDCEADGTLSSITVSPAEVTV